MSAHQDKSSAVDEQATSTPSQTGTQGSPGAAPATGRKARKARKPAHKPFQFDDLHKEELKTISGTDDGVVLKNLRESSWGLALSGGGIRSATFSLGVLQVLAREGLLKGFHYLSTVSGGGYTGAMLQNLIARHGIDHSMTALDAQVDNDRELGENKLKANRPVRHLREYSNYLSPKTGLLSGDTLALIATYLRNLLLVQIQLVAFMIFLGCLPFILYLFKGWVLGEGSASLVVTAGVLAMVASMLLGLVSWHDRRAQRHSGTNDQTWTRSLATVIVLMLVTASFVAAVGLAKMQAFAEFPGVCGLVGAASGSERCHIVSFGSWITAAYAGVWLLWYGVMAGRWLLDRWWWRRYRPTDAILRHSLRYWVGTVIAALVGGLLLALLFSLSLGMESRSGWLKTVLLTPLIFAVVGTTASIHLGLVGAAMTELQREVWSRVGGRTMAFIVLGVCASIGLLIFGPWGMTELMQHSKSNPTGENQEMIRSGWLGVIVWAVTSLAGVITAYKQLNVGDGLTARVASLLVRVAPWIFILGLWVMIGMLVQWFASLAGWGQLPFVGEHADLDAYLLALSAEIQGAPAAIFIVAGAALSIWLVFSYFINANACSMNAFYKNRLVRCYLGAGHAHRLPELITGFDPDDDCLLSTLVPPPGSKQPRPLYPLMGGALNLVRASDLDWQNRKAGSFLMSPRFCGHVPPPGREQQQVVGDINEHSNSSTAWRSQRLAEKHPPIKAEDKFRQRSQLERETQQRLTHSISLGQAMAISGAAVNSNMGRLSTPAITFLLTLFDARLGWWLNNHNTQHFQPYPGVSGFSGLMLILEMLGLTHGQGKLVHVSDGGHFENLGLYELIRRRTHFILCVDAGADPKREFFDLGNAVHKCRVDFGVDISIDVNDLVPDSESRRSSTCVAIGRIDYNQPNVPEGLLLYIKPGLCGDEPADVMNYSRTQMDFPHQPTTDQFFDEAQIESYRRLGVHIAESTLAPVIERVLESSETFAKERLSPRSKDDFIEQLQRFWLKPLSETGPAFSQHGARMAELFSVLREDDRMQTLDAQLYPGWKSIATDLNLAEVRQADPGIDLHTRLPDPVEFRASFFFCQELIQLMELVYLDMNLETTWDHPDNRRWINTFKHWTWVPMFRLTWVLSAQTYGARFVSFCETRLDAPRLVPSLKLDTVRIRDQQHLEEQAASLYQQGRINFAERGILQSAAMKKSGPIDVVYLLQYDWGRDTQMSVQASRAGQATATPSQPQPSGTGTATDASPNQRIRLSNLTLGIAAVSGDTLVLFRIQDHLRRLGLGTRFMQLLISVNGARHVKVLPDHYGRIGVISATEAKQARQAIERMLKHQRLRQRLASRASNRK